MVETRVRAAAALSRTVYLLCGLPFVFLWLLSHGHAGGLFCLVPLILCVLQAFRPSRAIWAVLFLLYLVLAGAFGLFLGADIASLAGGGQAGVLLDLDDSVAFILLELYLVGFTVGLYRVRPPRVDGFSENPFASPPEDRDGAS